MRELDGVAHGVDVLCGGFEVLVDPDSARLADADAGGFGERRFGAHADRKDDDVGHDPFPASEDDSHLFALFFEPLDALFQIQRHALLQQVLVDV